MELGVILFIVNLSLFHPSSDLPLKCEKSRLSAISDLKKGNVKLMLQGGIASFYTKGQVAFEKKYKMHYFDLGCVAPIDLCIDHYNLTVAKYLDGKFGKVWRKEVKKEVVFSPKS